MILKRIFIAFTFPTLFAIASFGQTIVTIPKEFVETVPPKAGSNEWYPLNYSRNEFGVKTIEGKLEIKKAKELNICNLKITGGTIIGINRGEWGGLFDF